MGVYRGREEGESEVQADHEGENLEGGGRGTMHVVYIYTDKLSFLLNGLQ